MKIVSGKIIAAHGIQGEVKVTPLTVNPRRFKKGSVLYVEKENCTRTVTTCRKGDGIFIVKFAGVDDRNHAEALKGSLLQIEEEDVMTLPEDEYYRFQLLGMEVYEEDGAFLGELTDFVESGANEVYRITCKNGDYLLLPGLKQVVRKVDVANKRMTVSLLPGLKEACMYHES